MPRLAIAHRLRRKRNAGAVSAKGGDTVTLVVHDSFPNEDFAKAASEAAGYDVKVVSAGDGGELTSQLVLTQSAPIADAFFGVDSDLPLAPH